MPVAIQGDRCVIGLGDDLDRVLFSSANAGEMLFGRTAGHASVNGFLFADLFPDTIGHKLRNAFASAGSVRGMGLCYACEIEGREFDVIARSLGGYRILEFEPSAGRDTGATLELARALQQRLARIPSIERLARQAPQIMRTFTGFDRIVVSRFAPDGSAPVLGESFHPSLEILKSGALPSGLVSQVMRSAGGADDAMALMIADIDAEPVPVEPIDGADLEPIDLSLTCAEAPASETAAALHDMEMSACALAIIRVDGAPWGLLGAFHAAPRRLSLSQRVAVEMLSGTLGQRVEVLEMRELRQVARQTHDDVAEALAMPPVGTGGIGEFLATRLPLLKNMMTCDGVGLWLDGAWHTHASTPPDEDMALLREIPRGTDHAAIWVEAATAHGADSRSHATTTMVVALSNICDDRLMFFRQEGDAPAAAWSETDRAQAEALRCALLELLSDHRKTDPPRGTD